MSGIILGYSHIDFHVSDIDAAAAFYTEGLGLRYVKRNPHNAIAETPDGVILEISGGGTNEWDKGGISHLCYNTDNAQAAFARALEAGAVPSRADSPEPVVYKDLRMAFVRTPSGEEIEFWSIIGKEKDYKTVFDSGKIVKQFVHAAITVPDMKKTVAFYEKLGAKLKVDWEWGCSMTLGDGREIELFTDGEFAKDPKAYRHIAFFTDDIERAAKNVVDNGGRIAHEPYEWSNLYVCFCVGIMGETIEFFQMHNHGEPDVFERIPDKLPNLFE